MADPIRRGTRDEAARQALGLLEQVDAGDALAIAWAGPDGRLGGGAAASADPAAAAALEAMVAGRTAEAPPEADFMGRAVAENQSFLLMGDLADTDAGTFPAPFQAWLLGGGAQANIGFLYVFPLAAPGHPPRGALMIHRALGAGPLNHDQPAIAHALAHLLGETAADA
jgi:hypothetical protein